MVRVLRIGLLLDRKVNRMTPEKADEFAAKLAKLCHREKIMIWTPLATQPMVLSDVEEGTRFYYIAEPPLHDGDGYKLRRKLIT